MKILILGDINSVHIKRWSQSLANSGIEIILFSFQSTDSSWYKDLGIKVYTREVKKTGNFLTKNLSKLQYLLAPITIRAIIKKHQPDCMHSHFLTSYGVVGYLSKFKPHIISVWGSDVYYDLKHNTKLKKSMHKALANADLILSTSAAMVGQIESYKATTKILPFGIDTELFKPLESNNINNITYTIGTVKSLKHIYGIDILIDVFRLVKNELNNCRLVLVGSGEELENYQQKVQQLELEDSVQFVAFKPNTEIPEIITTFDIFANLSRNESFGVSVIEASACGIPVIASNIEGLKEVVLPNETGCLVDLSDTQAIAEQFISLLKNEKLRLQMGKAGREFVQQKLFDNFVHC